MSDPSNKVFEPLFGKKIIQEAAAYATSHSAKARSIESEIPKQAATIPPAQPTSISKVGLGFWEENKNKVLMIAAAVVLLIIIAVLLLKQKDQNKKVNRLALEMKKMKGK